MPASKYNTLCILCITTLGIMFMAFYNGYPLVSPDTGTYIDTAFNFYMPPDRPPFYGMFLRISSLSVSLWYSVFAQSFILAFLLYRLSGLVYGNQWSIKLYTTGFIMILAFTYISWVSSFLMADTFTPILLLAMVLYLYRDTPLATLIYLPLIAAATLMHNSHFVITLLFAFFILVMAINKRSGALAGKGMALLSVSICCYLLICSMNLLNHKKFTFASGSHVFMMGRLAETGILNTYLGDHCATEKYKLCSYVNVIPGDAGTFIWDPNSPFYKTGGWDSSALEYNHIIHHIFTQPKYVVMFVAKSATSTLRQLSQINIPEKPTLQGKGSGIWVGVTRYFHHEEKEYLASKQNFNVLDVNGLNFIYGLFLVASSIFAVWYINDSPDHKQIKNIYFAIIILIVLNAFATATFGNVLDRLQNRVFWLLPALNAMLLARYLYEVSGIEKRTVK
ncbi:MAG: hypothetical protein P4L41_15040 [Flavipsychrobacter sp.]|nr:hypothetical protein [Flavipsychrobacter sp.]